MDSSKKAKKTPSSSTSKSLLKSPTSSTERASNLKKREQDLRSRLPKQEKIVKRMGPYVHVEGGSAVPSFSNVVNSCLDAPSSSGGARAGLDDHQMQAKAAQGQYGATSTLAPTYDAKRPDESWVCVFCKRSSHQTGLGDLFGPYFVSPEAVKAGGAGGLLSPRKGGTGGGGGGLGATDKEMAAKFILGGDPHKKKKKRKASEAASPGGGGASAAPSDQLEVWFHEDCVCWMPEVTLIGSRLLGLEDAVSGAAGTCCSLCKSAGATIRCLKPGCRDAAHFPCAREGRWMINEYNFEAYCPKHYPMA